MCVCVCVCVCLCEREREREIKEVCIQRDNFIVWGKLGVGGSGSGVGAENNRLECHCV